MKRVIIVTVVVAFVAAVCLGGIFYWRDSGMENSSQNEKESTQEEAASQREKETEVSQTEAAQTEIPQSETEAVSAKDTVLVFAGDVLIQNPVKSNYDNSGIDGVITEELALRFQEADVAMVNEEFPFSTRGTPMEDKQYTFRADPSYVQLLVDMGIDIVSLANNHTLDYGKEAMLDTFAALDGANIRYAGAGETKERAMETQVVEVNGKRFGFLAASRVIPVVEWNVENSQPGVFATYDPTALCQQIEEAKTACDYVVVYVHWGVERETYPEAYQKTLAEQYIDAGADFVVGTHTHCLQGIAYYKGKPIFYGLGNFISVVTLERTLAVELTVDGDGNTAVQLIPAKAAGGQTKAMTEEESKSLYQYMEQISEGIQIDDAGVVTER